MQMLDKMFADSGPMLEHEKRIGYSKIVENAQKLLYRPKNDSSSESSEDAYAFTMSREQETRMKEKALKKSLEI